MHACIHTLIHHITLHYIKLQYIIFHYNTLHYITLNYIHTYIHTYLLTYIAYHYIPLHTLHTLHTLQRMYMHTYITTCTNISKLKQSSSAPFSNLSQKRTIDGYSPLLDDMEFLHEVWWGDWAAVPIPVLPKAQDGRQAVPATILGLPDSRSWPSTCHECGLTKCQNQGLCRQVPWYVVKDASCPCRSRTQFSGFRMLPFDIWEYSVSNSFLNSVATHRVHKGCGKWGAMER